MREREDGPYLILRTNSNLFARHTTGLLLRAHSFRDHVDNDPQRQLNRWASSARARETGGWSTEQVLGREFGEGHCAGVAVPLEAGM